MHHPIGGILSWMALSALTSSAHAQGAPSYQLTMSTSLGAPDRWDYVTYDGPSNRVYVAHSDRVSLVDSQSGALVGQIEGIPGGTHGIGVSHASDVGFTDDGKAGEAVIFDLATLKVKATVAAAPDADGIVFDKISGHMFIIEGDSAQLQVFDPATQTAIATIPAGGGLEFGVSDGLGHIYVNGAQNLEIIRIDTRTNLIDGRWPIGDCISPHGLAMDIAHHRLFSSCSNSRMMVLDSETGQIVARLAIGKGSDAVAFDPKRNRVFSPNGIDGTLSVYQELSPDSYVSLGTIPIGVSGRTMALDPDTGRLFIAAADTDPTPLQNGRARVLPGTLRLLMLDPVANASPAP